MAPALSFRGNKYKNLKINIYPKAEFNEILSILNGISIVGERINQEHIMYAVLELVNNSLRAHREKGIAKPMNLHFSAGKDGLFILLKDFGGGFDPRRLPYDINEPVSSIDTNGEAFQFYREKHGYKRFGIGLYVARKTFASFTIKFFDGKGVISEYKENETKGTRIEMMGAWSRHD